ITEADPIDPKSPYGLSKYMGEQIIRMYGRLYGLKYSILRLFNVYGPGQRMEYAGVVSKFVMNAIRGEPFIVYGDGTQTRDFIHVLDVARIVEKMISQDVFSNEIYNVGTGQPISILDLTGVISRIIGKDLVVIRKPRRKGDILHSVADISKLKHMISFEPAIHIEEGIKLLIEEYRSSSA
ncbi:MAG: NAD-dependent epimerase/dehydratase family protein, partial [Thermosphaera sp.]